MPDLVSRVDLDADWPLALTMDLLAGTEDE